MELSIIYVNWNSLDYLRKSIASVHAHTRGLSFEILVVDNASQEDGLEGLQREFPDVLLIKSPENLGFARANNLGFRHSSGKHVLFLNPDTELIGPAISVLLDRTRALHDAGITGCKLLNTDLSVQLTAIQKFPTILNQVLDAEYLQLRWPDCRLWEIGPLLSGDTSLLKVEVISGACMLLRREIFARVAGFSEDYFMYAEDIDLNYKVTKAGYTNYYVGDAVIVHHGGKSSSRQNVSHWATVMKYRAMRTLFQKTHGPLYASLYRTAIGLAAVVRLVLLGVAYALGNIIWDRKALRFAVQKWQNVLKWAMGWPNWRLKSAGT